MSDTCIVCLGDLSTGIDGDTVQSNATAKSPLFDGAAVPILATETLATTTTEAPELIAHIQPCGHDLHNACLTPWVERANSCPICRATFHLVDLMHHVGGEVISSYAVQDRTQVADLDPSMFLEDPDEDDEDQPCQACGEYDNEDVLMFCDGCDKLWHTYCVDLQEVPRGEWFCNSCRARLEPRSSNRRGGASRRRTRGQQRRQRGQRTAYDSDWNDVWQSVFSRLGMDLDFPHDEEGAPASAMRRHRQRVQASRTAHHAWQSRVRVAELAGAGHTFRENEAAILNNNSRRARASPRPYVETPEEKDAWDMFEEASAPSPAASSSRKRKRAAKSETASPASPQERITLVVKRRHLSQPTEPENSARSTESPLPTREVPRASPVPRRLPMSDSGAPNFLQSLLQEVEDSSTSGNNLSITRPQLRTAGSPLADHSSPGPSSPALSPLPSNHSSPRAMSATPPPLPSGMRPNSPGLSSSIQPVFPSADYSPLRSSPEPRDKNPASSPLRAIGRTGLVQPKPERPMSRIPVHAARSRRPRSTDASPTRSTLSLMAKSDVQKLVSAALKPHYNEQTISKDEYTMINRDVSRMLYEKIGDFETLDLSGKAKWEKVAGEEVTKAIGALRAQG